MAVVSLNGFRTEPGKLAQHLAATAEALGHLRRLDLRAVNLQAMAGTDVGTIATSINYASNAEYATGIQRVLSDEKWQEFWIRATTEASAVQVESSLLFDLDRSFQPAVDRPLGAILATQWRARPGRLADFIGHAMAAVPHITRLGGQARIMQSLVGAHPMTTMFTTAFADLDAYGAYSDATAADDEWQTFWAGVMADPTADLIRSGLYVNISGD